MERQEPFKNRFVKAMEIRGLKSVDICKKTGIRDSTISQYRNGYAEPKAPRLNLLAEALYVNPTWLMGLDAPMEVEAPKTQENAHALADIMKDAKLMEAVKKIMKLDEAQKSKIYSYIDFVFSTPSNLQ